MVSSCVKYEELLFLFVPHGAIVTANVPTILILGGTALKCLKDYTDQKAQGLNPHFIASSIGLKEKTDFWNE